jgi:spectrin beta
MSRFEDFKQRVRTGSERFVQCEKAAQTLLERKPAFSREIVERQEQLRAAWSLLLDYIETRERKLTAAEEIHRFNRDAAEMLGRIQVRSLFNNKIMCPGKIAMYAHRSWP